MEVSIRRVAAATRIQAAFRGRLVRRELIDAVRVDFEEVMRRVEGPLRSLDLNAATPSKPWGELGWKSPRRLSPPSVLDLDMEISPDSDAGNDAADRAPRIDESDDGDDASARAASRVAAAIEGVRLVRGRADEGATAADDERAREMRLSTLRQELAWAKAALDDRRQHLRRLRWQQSQR
tara:strand:+ start:723 stop:1262 length:540 start_codon:yes stop_codon:yes gene_type:complete